MLSAASKITERFVVCHVQLSSAHLMHDPRAVIYIGKCQVYMLESPPEASKHLKCRAVRAIYHSALRFASG